MRAGAGYTTVTVEAVVKFSGFRSADAMCAGAQTSSSVRSSVVSCVSVVMSPRGAFKGAKPRSRTYEDAWVQPSML